MAIINNPAVMQKLIDELKLYPGKDVIPSELAEKILPVFQINSEQVTVSTAPATIVRDSQTQTNTLSTTIYTVPAATSGTFYLTNAYLNFMVNTGVGASGTFFIGVTIDGVVRNILAFEQVTDTAGNHDSAVINLQNPIKIDPETNITMSNDIGIVDASVSEAAGIVGYLETA